MISEPNESLNAQAVSVLSKLRLTVSQTRKSEAFVERSGLRHVMLLLEHDVDDRLISEYALQLLQAVSSNSSRAKRDCAAQKSLLRSLVHIIQENVVNHASLATAAVAVLSVLSQDVRTLPALSAVAEDVLACMPEAVSRLSADESLDALRNAFLQLLVHCSLSTSWKRAIASNDRAVDILSSVASKDDADLPRSQALFVLGRCGIETRIRAVDAGSPQTPVQSKAARPLASMQTPSTTP